MRSFRPKITRSPICAGVLHALMTVWKASVCRNLGRNSMVIHCVNFGSLWWLRPGNKTSDPLRFSSHAAVFNTTGFVSGSRERRLWHIAGVIRINLGMHRDTDDARRFEAARYECTGLERRGEWNRLLLGRRLDRTVNAEKIIVCTRSSVIGRIQFDASWHGNGIQVLAGSAFRGEQETLLLAAPGAQLQTDAGDWEVLWDGLAKR